MRLNEIRLDGRSPVDGYGPGFFRIGGVVHRGAVLVLPSGVQPWGGWADRAGLIAAAPTLDFVFVGTGATIAHLPADFRAEIEATGLGLEGMASAPACRTYNVLLSEGRRVGLALMPV